MPFAALVPYTIVYLLFLFVLLYVCKKHRRWYAAAKALLSSMFVLASLLAFNWQNKALFTWLFAALLFCAAGDLLLGIANLGNQLRRKVFVAGALLFLLAHILLLVLFVRIAGWAWTDFVLPATALVVLLWLDKAQLVRLKAMRPIAYLYTFFVALMTGRALGIPVYALAPGAVWVLRTGVLLFFVSDVILLFLYFGKKRVRPLRYANLTTYYLGIYLLAICSSWL